MNELVGQLVSPACKETLGYEVSELEGREDLDGTVLTGHSH